MLTEPQELTNRYMPAAEEHPEQPSLGGPLVGQLRDLRVAAQKAGQPAVAGLGLQAPRGESKQD